MVKDTVPGSTRVVCTGAGDVALMLTFRSLGGSFGLT